MIREYLRRDEISLSNEIANAIRQAVIEIVQIVGYLQLLDLYENLGLNLKLTNDEYLQVINMQNLSVNVTDLIDKVVQKSNTNLTSDAIQKKFEKLILNSHNPWLLCRGHDLVKVLALVVSSVFSKKLHRQIANRYKDDIKEDKIDRLLRNCYDFVCFKTTTTFQKIQTWEVNNIPYKILKE